MARTTLHNSPGILALLVLCHGYGRQHIPDQKQEKRSGHFPVMFSLGVAHWFLS